MKSITLRNKNNVGEYITVTADVVENGKVLFSKQVQARSKQEMDGTLANILAIANQVQKDFDAVTEGEWTPPVVEEPAPEPAPEKTADELAQEEWLEQWNRYKRAKKGMQELKDAGVTPTTEEQTTFDTLKKWVADNRKPEYTHLIADTI